MITIKDVELQNILDLCLVCVPKEKRQTSEWQRGIEEKRLWAIEMLQKWGSFAKIAYYNDNPAGMIQYWPVSEENVVQIGCIYIQEKEYWRKGIGTELLRSLVKDMKKSSKWFGNKAPSAIIVHTFSGESEGQLSAREFFAKRGFRPIGNNPDVLFLPLINDFIYQLPEKKSITVYKPQDEDREKVLIFYGPNKCPAAYPFFLKRMEQYIREVDCHIPIIYVDISKESDKAKIRNANYGDCIVNNTQIKAFVLDKTNFQREVKEALKNVHRLERAK